MFAIDLVSCVAKGDSEGKQGETPQGGDGGVPHILASLFLPVVTIGFLIDSCIVI